MGGPMGTSMSSLPGQMPPFPLGPIGQGMQGMMPGFMNPSGSPPPGVSPNAPGKVNNDIIYAVDRHPQAMKDRMNLLKSQIIKNEKLSLDVAASLLLGDIPSLYRPTEHVPNYQYLRDPNKKKHDFIGDIPFSYEKFQ